MIKKRWLLSLSVKESVIGEESSEPDTFGKCASVRACAISPRHARPAGTHTQTPLAADWSNYKIIGFDCVCVCGRSSESAWCRSAEPRVTLPRTWAMWRICGASKAEPVLFGDNADDDFVSLSPLRVHDNFNSFCAYLPKEYSGAYLRRCCNNSGYNQYSWLLCK